MHAHVIQEPEAEHVQYIPWDFKYYAKLRGGEILADIAPVVTRCLNATGLYLCAPAPPSLEARRTNDTDWVRAPHCAPGPGLGCTISVGFLKGACMPRKATSWIALQSVRPAMLC